MSAHIGDSSMVPNLFDVISTLYCLVICGIVCMTYKITKKDSDIDKAKRWNADNSHRDPYQ